jgi:hypothetical protein
LLAVLAWIALFSAVLAGGLPALKNIRENAGQMVGDGMAESDAREYVWDAAWSLYSLPRKLFFAGAMTLLLEVAAGLTSARKRDKKSAFSRRLARPPGRRFWFASSRTPGGYFARFPIVVAAGYLVAFIAFRTFLFCALRQMLPLSEFTTPEQGVSLALMVRLLTFSFIGYLVAHVVYGLFPATRAPMHQRFLLIFAIIVILTSSFSVPAPL